MLRLALLFLVIALVAAIFGFGSVADIRSPAAQSIFYLSLLMATVLALGETTGG